jgi:hypothetical protein
MKQVPKIHLNIVAMCYFNLIAIWTAQQSTEEVNSRNHWTIEHLGVQNGCAFERGRHVTSLGGILPSLMWSGNTSGPRLLFASFLNEACSCIRTHACQHRLHAVLKLGDLLPCLERAVISLPRRWSHHRTWARHSTQCHLRGPRVEFRHISSYSPGDGTRVAQMVG